MVEAREHSRVAQLPTMPMRTSGLGRCLPWQLPPHRPYQYTLNPIVTDSAGHPDSVMLPLLE